MKYLLAFLLCITLANIYAQTAEEFLQNGIDKHNQKDYKGAISEYSKSIKNDKSLTDAYFNRGSCYLALKDYNNALNDFNKTIEQAPQYFKAYYSKATIFVIQEKYNLALEELDKTIAIHPQTPNALTLRGQIRAQTNNKIGACQDFSLALEYGDSQAQKYLNQFCGNQQLEGESFALDWPDSEKWKIANQQEDKTMVLIELVREHETLENWTEIGSMISIKGAKNIPVETMMNILFDESKSKAPKSILTVIEKDENTEYPWIIFTIESPSFKNSKSPESQIWIFIQGKTSAYNNFVAVKKAKLSPDFIKKWSEIFKKGKIVYK